MASLDDFFNKLNRKHPTLQDDLRGILKSAQSDSPQRSITLSQIRGRYCLRIFFEKKNSKISLQLLILNDLDRIFPSRVERGLKWLICSPSHISVVSAHKLAQCDFLASRLTRNKNMILNNNKKLVLIVQLK